MRKLFVRIAAMQRGLGRGLWDTTGERQHGQQWCNPFHFSADFLIGAEGRTTCVNTRPNDAGSLSRPVSRAVSRMRGAPSLSDNFIFLAGAICLSKLVGFQTYWRFGGFQWVEEVQIQFAILQVSRLSEANIDLRPSTLCNSRRPVFMAGLVRGHRVVPTSTRGFDWLPPRFSGVTVPLRFCLNAE